MHVQMREINRDRVMMMKKPLPTSGGRQYLERQIMVDLNAMGGKRNENHSNVTQNWYENLQPAMYVLSG